MLFNDKVIIEGWGGVWPYDWIAGGTGPYGDGGTVLIEGWSGLTGDGGSSI